MEVRKGMYRRSGRLPNSSCECTQGVFTGEAKFSVWFYLPIIITFALLTFSNTVFLSSMKKLTKVRRWLNCGKVTMYGVQETGLHAPEYGSYLTLL